MRDFLLLHIVSERTGERRRDDICAAFRAVGGKIHCRVGHPIPITFGKRFAPDARLDEAVDKPSTHRSVPSERIRRLGLCGAMYLGIVSIKRYIVLVV